MKKKSTRVLAMLLAFVMLISASCVTAFAKQADVNTPLTDENGKYYFSYEAGGTYVMNLLDELLSGLNNGMDMYIDAKITSWTLTLQSYDKALGSVYGMWNSGLINAAKTLGLAGNLKDLNVGCLASYTKRSDATRYDVECLYNVLNFLYDNQDVLAKILNGSFNWGIIDNVVDLPDALLNTSDFLANTLYTLLMGLSGKEEGDADTATTYDKNGKDIDGAINEILIWFLNDKLGELLNFEGGLGLTRNEVNVTDIGLYDMVNNILQSALDNLVVPLLKDVLMGAFDIETSEAYPNGTADQMNNSTMTMVLGIVEDLLSEAETKPDYSNCQYPGEKIETLLEWFFLEGGMGQYIRIDSDGLALEDGFVDLLNSLSRLAVPLIYSMGFDYLPKDYLYSSDQLAIKEGDEGYIPTSAVFAQLVNVLLSSFIEGYYCNPEASTIGEIGAYALASLCARVVPEINYIDQLDANYSGGTMTDYNGNTVNALPFYEDWTITGQWNNNGTWTQKASTYKVPSALIDMAVTVAVFFLDGLLTADFSQVPATGAATPRVRFEKLVKVLIDWAVEKYLPLFETTYNLKTKYPNYTYVWKEIDEILFGLIPTSWLPATITDRTMSDEYTSKGNNGQATFELKTSADLVGGWLLGSVLDLDLQELVSIFQRNKTANAEFNQPTLTVLLRLIDRVFYIVLGKYALLPNNQGTRDAYSTPTSITSLNNDSAAGLLQKNNLGNLVKYLARALGGGGNTFNAQTKAVPILQTALPLIMGITYIKPYRQNILSSGEITVDKLEELVNLINGQGSKTIAYTEAYVDDSTIGTYYVLDDSLNAVAVNLDGTNYDSTETYYTIGYKPASVDRFTVSSTFNNGDGVYVATERYNAITLDGTNYKSGEYYYSTDYTVATVDEKTNGTYYTAQDETSAVTLPDAYRAGQTYYKHPEVVIGANTTGTYYTKSVTYSPITLTGTSGTNFNENKTYYMKIFTNVSFNYLDSYSYTGDPTKGRLAMGVYSANAKGIGVYTSSIASQDFFVYRDGEDFPDALYSYFNFQDFIKDAEEFIGEYKAFLESMKADADTWKEYLAYNGAEEDMPGIPSTNYPFYTADGNYGRRVTEQNLSGTEFNNLQAIRDFKAIYGVSSFITSTTTNRRASGSHNSTVPMSTLPSSHNAGTMDMEGKIYTQWNKYVQDVVKYSNNLNNYYDGINFYLQTAESNRQSYTLTSVAPLEWALYSLTLEAYNGGQNRQLDEVTGQYVPIYTEKSYNAFKKAYEVALSVVDQVSVHQANVKTTQSMVTKARSGLIEAFYNLVKAGELADKTQLYTAIVQARLTLADTELDATFTQNSIATLRNVLASASSLFEEVTEIDDQPIVDNLAARLNGAIAGLVYLEAPGVDIDPDAEGDSDINIGDKFAESGIQKGFIYGLLEGIGLIRENPAFNIKGIKPENVSVVESSYGVGTGASLVGKNGSDTKFEFYAVVYGDINGDARIDGTDKAYVQAYTIGASNTNLMNADRNSGAALKAADVDGDGNITASDAADIGKVSNYEATINQAADIQGTRVVLA